MLSPDRPITLEDIKRRNALGANLRGIGRELMGENLINMVGSFAITDCVSVTLTTAAGRMFQLVSDASKYNSQDQFDVVVRELDPEIVSQLRSLEKAHKLAVKQTFAATIRDIPVPTPVSKEELGEILRDEISKPRKMN